MNLKVCFKQQIYRIPIPDTYKGLVETIKDLYQGQLPNQWMLQYVDSEGDNVILSDKSDFRNLVEDRMQSNQAIKVLIIALEDHPDNFKVVQESSQVTKKQEETIQPEVTKPQVESKPSKIPEIKETQLPSEKEEKTTIIGKDNYHQIKKIVKKLVKGDLNSSERKELEKKFDSLEVRLTEQEKVRMLEKKMIYAKKHAQKDAKMKTTIQTIVQNMLFEQLQAWALSTKQSKPKDYSLKEGPSKPAHIKIACNGCGIFPIVGKRFKCCVCPDLDYCEACERRIDHPHNFWMLKSANEIRVSSNANLSPEYPQNK